MEYRKRKSLRKGGDNDEFTLDKAYFRRLWEIEAHAGVWSLKILLRAGDECDL